jgi:cell wall-associated NlpC family hydrolase
MQRLTKEQRTKIVRAAKDWLGTPYHHHARVKHAGADCAMFPLAVYQECGVLPLDFQPPEYSVQWHLHRSEELYLNEIEKFTVEIDAIPQPGDFVVFRFGRTYSHGAIVVEWPIVIHSYIPHGVLLSDALRDGELLGRERKCFEVRPMAAMEMASRSGTGLLLAITN